jgi:2-dehydro-3-deoxygalactonokinase
MSAETRYADWIAVDWGTSHLRAWAMGGGGAVRADAASDDGMARLASEEFEPALLRLIEPWLGQGDMPVLACGMLGARGGWVEVPYVSVPAKPRELTPVAVGCLDPRLRLWVMPGLSQSRPPDVMRGEETQIAGFLAANPGFDGILCLPGTHTKWVHLSAQEVVSFQTAMTGEMFRLLSENSLLRDAVTAPDMDEGAFAEAVSDTLSRPERLGQRLFGLRAEKLLQDLQPATARARLSGALIGAELAATRAYWLGQEVAIAGAPALVDLYTRALETQGVSPTRHYAAPLTLAGLSAVRSNLQETIP